MSDENEATPVNPRTVSPRSTAMIERNNRNYLRDLKKARCKVKIMEEVEEIDEPSDSEYEEDEQDNKVSRNKKHHRQ